MSKEKTIEVTNDNEVLIRVAGPAGSLVPVEPGETVTVPAYMAEACTKAMLKVKTVKRDKK